MVLASRLHMPASIEQDWGQPKKRDPPEGGSRGSSGRKEELPHSASDMRTQERRLHSLGLMPQPQSVAPFGGSHFFFRRLLGLTPQAMSLSRLRRSVSFSREAPVFLGDGSNQPRSGDRQSEDCGCGSCRSRNLSPAGGDRRLLDFSPDSLPFAEVSIDEITWPLVQAAVANGIEGRLVEADAGCAAADDRFHRRPLRSDATVEPL